MPLLLAALLVLWPLATPAADLVSYAFVQDDGSLKVRGRTVHLYGILIPATERTCRAFLHPIECGPRAVLALDFKVGARFVHCDPQRKRADGSIVAVCRIDGEDLGAWMLEQGWAMALSYAPPEYQALERIARHRGRGVWGIPVDNFRGRNPFR
jgi:endonuclease YncB( thermonuclease family)